MYTIIGLGKSGLSVARFLREQGMAFSLVDTRQNPPELAAFRQEFAHVDCILGEVQLEKLLSSSCIVVSPGLTRQHAALQAAIHAGIPVIGDIELFVQYAKAPVIAITGTNAKGTVTTMTAGILEAAGKKVYMGGNIGTPALDLLLLPTPDFYVLELSSFQLESTFSLQPIAATILNVTEDHLDYHGCMESYINAKQRVYHGAKNVIYNRDDKHTELNAFAVEAKNYSLHGEALTDDEIMPIRWSFGLDVPQGDHAFGVQKIDGQFFLCYGKHTIMAVNELNVFGQHNWANALAACALAASVGASTAALRQGLKKFHGLHHRCEKIITKNNITWIDDSKGTNVGATQAALAGIGPTVEGKIILIAGGQGKGQSFLPLVPLCQTYVKQIILFGQDAPLLEQVFSGAVATLRVETLAQAIKIAQAQAQDGDVVLLSPACASLDMFKSYEDRGQQFVAEVKKLVGG